MKTILLFLILPLSLLAQKNYSSLVDRYMNAAVNVNQFSGSVLIAKHNDIIYQKTFGTIDFANTKFLDSNSMFELGNITEEFTATAILLLKQKDKLKLTDTITKYLPELPYNTVTIKHLLTHTSGLPDFYDEGMKDKWGTERFATNDDVVKSLANVKAPLAWKPGTKYDEYHYYTDYPLLASIIEKVSGLSYKDFMQQNIFNPLQLNNTKVFAELEANKKLHANHTESVFFDESKQQFFPPDSFKAFSPELGYATNAVVGTIGISSTAHDLFLFNRALKNNQLLLPSTQKEMVTPYFLKDSLNNIFFGYGVLTGKNEIGTYVQQRDGGNNITLGYITTVINYPLEDFTIIVLANKAKNSSNIAGTLSYILFNRKVVPPYIHKQVSIDTSLLDKYVGEYKLPRIVKVYKKDGTLWITIPGEPDLKLLAESPTKFFSSNKEYDWQIEFETDASGNVLKTYFIFSGLRKEAKKI
jgi:CubicO group peptidase (beta-lactamase class C family)